MGGRDYRDFIRGQGLGGGGVLWFSGVYERCFAALCKGAEFSFDR